MGKPKSHKPIKKRRTAFRKVSDARLRASLIKNDGGFALVGRDVGLTRQTVHDRVYRNPELVELIHDIGVGLVDLAESTLGKRMRKYEDREAAKFVLQNKGKSRGYGPQPEIPPPPPDDSKRAIIIQNLVMILNEKAAAIHAPKPALDITPKPNGHLNGSAAAQLIAAKKGTGKL